LSSSERCRAASATSASRASISISAVPTRVRRGAHLIRI
jgi:hypothetical protein